MRRCQSSCYWTPSSSPLCAISPFYVASMWFQGCGGATRLKGREQGSLQYNVSTLNVYAQTCISDKTPLPFGQARKNLTGLKKWERIDAALQFHQDSRILAEYTERHQQPILTRELCFEWERLGRINCNTFHRNLSRFKELKTSKAIGGGFGPGITFGYRTPLPQRN